MLLSFAALVTLAGSAEAIKIALVIALGNSPLAPEVRKALSWDPGNAALHSRLAQIDGSSLEPANLSESVQEARRATELEPNKSDYWMTLASTCEAVGDNACADQASQRALTLSPRAPQIWWATGNHYLRTDRADSALACFHRLLELSPDYAEPVFALTLRAYGNPKLILENVVGDEQNPRLGLAFADFMSAHGQFDAAHQAWSRIAAARAPFPFAAVEPYLERLLSQRQYQEAQAVWLNLEARGVIAKSAEDAPGNLVFNGGFEQPPLGGGFDWRVQLSGYASVDFADPSPYQGAHCLRVDFPVGQNDDFEPVYQILPVVPKEAYTLAAYVRSREIASDSGPRLRVTDADCPGCLDAATEASVGTTPWHQVALRFSAGPQTRAVRVSVWRPRSRVFPMEISGSFWLDSVSVHAEPH